MTVPRKNDSRPDAGERRWRILFLLLVVLGLAARVLVAVLPGNAAEPAWSGGGDTRNYITLARNLAAGDGFAYTGQPTAFRPPVYPLLLAGLMRVFGEQFAIVCRVLQLLLGLVTVYLGARLSRHSFGDAAFRPGFVVALFFPTLVFFSSTLLPEALAAFLAILFLVILLEAGPSPDLPRMAGVGAIAGLAALLRFNMGALVMVPAWLLRSGRFTEQARRVVLAGLCAALVIAPWVLRNYFVFDGQVYFSTQSGLNALKGVMTAQGRAQADESQRVGQVLGWDASTLESNSAGRLALGPEPELNRQAWSAARQAWKDAGWQVVPNTMRKLGYFWLSTDQLFWTESFSMRQRLLRAAGVLVYWGILALAVLGWLRLKRENREAALLVLWYAAMVTAMHLPFIMSTRHRVPFLDPLLAALAGGGILALGARWGFFRASAEN